MIPSSKLKTRTPSDLPKTPNLLVSGVSGAGKTSFLGSIGPGAKALIADTEGGTVSYQSAWFQEQPTSAKLSDLHIIDFDDVTTAQELVQRVEGALDYLIRTKNSDGYTHFALDSLGEFQQRFLSLHTAPDPRQSYGALKDALYTIVHKARQAPLITVFTARLKFTEDAVLGREVVRPDLSPAVWSMVSGLFDDIGFLDIKTQGITTRRTLDFAFKVRTQGKDRHGFGEIPDPTFVALKAKLDGTPDDTSKPTPTVPARRTAAAAAPRRTN